MFGRLSLDALPHEPIVLGGAISMGIVALLVVCLLFYFKRWKWLYKEWLTSLDPKKIGVMYIIVAVLMLLRGVADAGMMRAQQILSVGDAQGILTSEHFQQVFSAHGTIMIFFVAMGLMFGLINLIMPLQIGARDVAFPFLNSVSFWFFVAGMMLINLSLVLGEFSAAGWLAYPPLSGIAYSPGVGVDYWIWALQIAGIGSLLSGINFLTTILKMRAPGMTLMRMPIFVWTVMGSMILVIFAFPILTATLGMLSLDRLLGMHFFTSDFGGNPMMYINLIWAWGHPEVYILILPAFGVFSEVVATFSRKKLFGYTSMVWAICAITFLSYVVWLHHFFTMGAGANVNAFFGIMTMIIAIPTGVKVFNWLFTMFRGRVHFTSTMVWFLGFVATFTIGGMTGVLLAVPAIDFQVHNSLFLVAHFHNMVIGGVVFGYMAGITYWFPKIFGFTLHEKLGKYAAYCWIVGFFVAFIPLYILGFMGATRRLDHYDASMGWQGLFVVAGIGAGIIMLGIGLQVLQFVVSIWQRKQNIDTTGDPWNGRTLEWSTISPAPFYNFAIVPEISGRDTFWQSKNSKSASTEKPKYEDIELPKNSPYGFVIAIFIFLCGFGIIWHIWWLAAIGLFAAIACFIVRSLDENTEYKISATKLAKLEALNGEQRA
ncbi:cytochrome o ubiquinol oxidase subunit I [Candidatus Saccharibacteria bacterium RIFCSPHIGHO2_12_FULL_42_8]|nr:MAG: cytochrome o ubiquinol oxidase subunit I [Candidatus Saccharibacteria bacterium RIFCSPHIGHO2_12_FULL_42_8]